MKIGIIVAMASERRQLERLMTAPREEHRGGLHFLTGQIGPHEVVLMQCGIGKVNAAMGTTILLREWAPEAVVSTGCAGGIGKGLSVMDVVVSHETQYHDVDCGTGLGCQPGQIQGLPLRCPGDPALVATARRLPTQVPIHVGLVLTGDQFVSDPRQLAGILQRFPEGLAVDMESAAIAQVCYLNHVPFVSFRVVSDTPGAEGHQQQYDDFWQAVADRSFGVTRQFLTAIA